MQQDLLMFWTEKLSITVIRSTASPRFHKRWLMCLCSDSQVTIYAVCKEWRMKTHDHHHWCLEAQSGCLSDCILKFANFCNKYRGFPSACLSHSFLVAFRISNSPLPFVSFQWIARVAQERRGNLGCRFSPAGALVRTAAILSDAEGLKSQSVPSLQAPASRTLAWPFSSQWQPENGVCDPEF